MRKFSMLFFDFFRWQISGSMPPEIHKCIMVAAPHTSNYDLLFAMGAYSKMGIPVKFLIKKEWTEFPFIGNLLCANGGIGIYRDKKLNLVDTLAEMMIKSTEDIALMVEPEGTRKMNKKWKTGFYQIALKAELPIALSFLDYRRKTAGIGPVFKPSGNYQKDMEIVKDFYKKIVPKCPKNFSLPDEKL